MLSIRNSFFNPHSFHSAYTNHESEHERVIVQREFPSRILSLKCDEKADKRSTHGLVPVQRENAKPINDEKNSCAK